MKKAYAYARFSSDRQREESIDAQLRAIREYCDREGIAIVHVFADRALSGTTDKRPQFQEMIDAVTTGDVDYVIVHKLDRFARNRYDSAYYRRQLKLHGVRLLSVLERFDDTPESIILESVIEGWNEYYSANLAREVMKGLKETALQCKHTGGRPPLGYKVNSEHTYEIDPSGAEIVRKIFALYAEGKSYSEILRALDGCTTGSGRPFGKNSLSEILRNEKYTGTYVFNRSASKRADGSRNNHKSKDDADIIRVPGGMPQIVTEAQFAAVAARLRARNANGSGSAKHDYLLSGKLVCGKCGAILVGATSRSGRNKTPYSYYTCGTRTRTGKCDMPRLSANVIEKIVLDAIAQMLAFTDEDIAYIYDLIVGSLPEESEYIKGLRRERENLQRKIGQLAALIAEDPSPTIAAEVRKLEKNVDVLTVAINAAAVPTLRPTLADVTAFCREDLDFLNMPRDRQKSIIYRLVDRIIVRGYDDLDLILRLPVSGDDDPPVLTSDGGGSFDSQKVENRLHHSSLKIIVPVQFRTVVFRSIKCKKAEA